VEDQLDVQEVNDSQTLTTGIDFVNSVKAVAGEVLVVFCPGSAAQIHAIRRNLQAKEIKIFPGIGIHHWRLPPQRTTAGRMGKFAF